MQSRSAKFWLSYQSSFEFHSLVKFAAAAAAVEYADAALLRLRKWRRLVRTLEKSLKLKSAPATSVPLLVTGYAASAISVA
jgi:hypothetical protein